MSEIWGSPYPYKSGAQNHLSLKISQHKENLMAYIFRVKHGTDNWACALQTTSGLLYHLKTTWTPVHKWLQVGSEFSPTLCKFCIPLHSHTLHAEISKCNSTKLCQTVGPWVALTICRGKVGVVHHEKIGGKKLYICSVFRQFQD